MPKPKKPKTPKAKRKAAAARESSGPSLPQLRAELNIVVDLIPRGNSNRPGNPLRSSKITIHNTDNDGPGADAKAHCLYQKGEDARQRKVSWHFTVDDHSIFQSLPVDEVGFHAGTRQGNTQSIGIEICENGGIDQAAANDRAARLTALMLHELGLPLGSVVQHNNWSGKDCPMLLRHPPSGWTSFLEDVARHHGGVAGDDHENDHSAPIGGTAGPGSAGGAAPLRNASLAGNSELQAAARGERVFARNRDNGEAIGIFQDALDRVLPASDRINAGANRGIFGPKTESAIMAFQRSAAIGDDGKIGRDTLLALDAALIRLDGGEAAPAPKVPAATAPAPTGPAPVGGIDEILAIAASSAIARYEWKNRGRAPLAYIKGMALTYGRVYCKLKAGDPAVMEMAKADAGDMARDAMAHYRQQFADLGMDNSVSGVDTLRHLFVLLTGLGMRESSGKHCEGLFAPDGNTTGETAEAGAFQTSYNARNSSPLLPPLFQKYLADPRGFLEVFSVGVRCDPANAINFGSGLGKEFQRLSKQCPAFAAEFAAIAMRHLRNHWGPMKNDKREAEVRPECDEMFKQVQAAIDRSKLCPALL